MKEGDGRGWDEEGDRGREMEEDETENEKEG